MNKPYEIKVLRIYFGPENPTNRKVTVFNQRYESLSQANAMADYIYRDAIERESAVEIYKGVSVLNNIHSFVQVVHRIDHTEDDDFPDFTHPYLMK